jgi:hypothetical protein
MMLLVAALAAAPVDPPRSVSFRLSDGVRISGQLTAWDEQGIDGSFGRREWTAMNVDDLWRLYRQLMDRESAAHWVALGRALLLAESGAGSGGAPKNAEQAFAQALRLDSSSQAAIDEVRAEVEKIRQRQEEARRAAEAQKLSTRSPEAGPFPTDPWPSLTDEQATAARATLRDTARQMLTAVGASDIEVIETTFFILLADAPRLEAAQWGWHLDQAVKKTIEILELNRQANPLTGRAAVFVLGDREKFRLIEVSAFRQLVPEKTRGIVHYRQDQAFINILREPDHAELADELARQAALAFLHVHRNARRLPAWAHEGLAAHVAGLVLPRSAAQRLRREEGRKFIRAGGDLHALMGAEYADERWPQQHAAVAGAGSLVVGLMIREQPSRFAAWVNAVKDGKAWEQALAEDFGVDRRRLADTAAKYFKVND